MKYSERITAHLINQEVTESELIRIYNNFSDDIYSDGFNEGCEYMRGVIGRQKACRKALRKSKCDEFLSRLDDYMHAV